MHLRGHSNILKHLLVHVAGLNLGLLLRQAIGGCRPAACGAASAVCGLIGRFVGLWSGLERLLTRFPAQFGADRRAIEPSAPSASHLNTGDFYLGLLCARS